MSGLSPTTEERAIEILAQHSIRGGVRDMNLHCLCGWETPTHGDVGARAKHRRHIVNQMAEAGLLVKRVRKAGGK